MCKLLFTAFSLLVLALSKNDGATGDIKSKHFEQGNSTTGCGHIMSVDAGSQITCSDRCLSQRLCKGMIFNGHAKHAQRCKLITSESTMRISGLISEHNYKQYSFKIPLESPCKDLRISVDTPTEWRAGCPKLYFPLDEILEGTAQGPDASTIEFAPGKINNSFYLPNPTGNVQAYFSLGNYPSTDYCFPEPQKCKDGVSFSFWLNILAPSHGTQGIITTTASGSPGFIINWSGQYEDIHIQFRRDSDTMIELIALDQQDFEESFAFGIWVHYIITYKFGAGIFGNNVELYLNGEVHDKSFKWTGPWPEANTADYDGRLEVGHYFLGTLGGEGNIRLDDLVIWEEQISCDDAYRLYHAYDTIVLFNMFN